MFKWSTSDLIALPLALIIIIAISLLLNKRLKTEKSRRIPFIVLAVLIVCLETSKQLYYIITKQYAFYILPIHFCSLFIFLFPLSHFFGEKFGKYFKPLSFVYSFLMLALLYIHPSSMIGSSTQNILGTFPNFHTFTHHHIVVAYFVLSVVMQDYKPQLKDCINNVLGIVVYASFGIPCAYYFNANYVNILRSFVPLLERFRLSAGQVWYNIVLFLIGTIGVCMITVIYYYLVKLINKNKNANG